MTCEERPFLTDVIGKRTPREVWEEEFDSGARSTLQIAVVILLTLKQANMHLLVLSHFFHLQTFAALFFPPHAAEHWGMKSLSLYFW